MNKISVQHLTHIYGANTPFVHTALQDVSFAVAPGELIGVIGHTGSGKSTLISHLNGLLKPTEGQILLDDKDIWAKPKEIRSVRFRVGLVFQYPEYQLFEDTVEKDIAYGPKNRGLSPDEICLRAEEAMRFVGLPRELAQVSPFELSGGQKRRVAIAGVMAMRPEVLILDEPTAGLDPRGCRDLLHSIEEYRAETGCTVLLVSHNMDEIARIADRVLVMRQGTVAAFDTPKAVFSSPELIENAGLRLPSVTKVMHGLRQAGLPLDASICTCEDAANAILALARERGAI